jgi:hypothetical protein
MIHQRQHQGYPSRTSSTNQTIIPNYYVQSWKYADIRELTSSQYEDISEQDMEVLNESLEELCEDLGGGEWEVEYSVCPLPIQVIPPWPLIFR